MKDFLTILTEKTHEFGNHYRKHLQLVKKYYEFLLDKIEIHKKREIVHFLHLTNNFRIELDAVAEVADTEEEQLNFIGTYFALHLLWMNRHLIDMLRMELLSQNSNRLDIYKQFMREAGNQFRNLTSVYIEKLLKIFMDKEKIPQYVIMGVGTKSDQDDIDVGIVDEGIENREALNFAIARVAREMLRCATSFHFHLSEHIGTRHYSASIDEYKQVLSRELRDFVIINEMLGAAVIVGDRGLFEKFQNEVINRYFYTPDGDNKYHEGYLRGIIGEVRALLTKPISKSHLNFKEDGLRPIKSIISAKKAVFNIWKVNAWDIIDELRKVDIKRKDEYDALEHSLTFIEIFRYLYQMFVTQDEEIILEEVTFKNIRKIASLLGYIDMGQCKAEQHMLVHYYEHIQNLRQIIPLLIDDLKRHLKENSIFTPLFEPNYQGNLVYDFIADFKFFRGTSFWDDILDDYGSARVLDRFITDFKKIPLSKQQKIVREYIDWLKYDLYTLFSFILMLGENKNCNEIYHALNEQFLQIMNQIPDITRNIAFVFSRYPAYVNRLLLLENAENLKFYLKILEEKIYEDEVASIIENLKGLIRIYLISSHYLKRYFVRITKKYPQCINFLNNLGFLKEFAEGIYSDIGSIKTYSAKKEKLGDYYDLEMVRVSLSTLAGTTSLITNTEFIEFSDQFIRTLYDICREEADAEFNKRIITEDVLAIFAAGGYAREQAFDDDYDLFVLLNSDDPELLAYSNKVISKMNAEIIKRGTIPHHRFADYFGRYVFTLKEIEHLLNEDQPNIFIEQSQILGARLIAGSHRFEKYFLKMIIQPQIFKKKEVYIQQMINEMRSRHPTEKEFINSGIDIKECAGGLRDIEMIMLILKAYLEITEPVNSKLFDMFSTNIPQCQNEFNKLAEGFNFLKNVRDIYRLTVGATDFIHFKELKQMGPIMDFADEADFYSKISRMLNEVCKIIKRIISILQNSNPPTAQKTFS